MRQVAGIREMFALFQQMDVMRGGGHARTALVEYMNSYVVPLLKRKHEPHVEQALYEAAAEQAYLLGWMAYDDGEHGLAQRYLIQALRLAETASATALGAHVLAGMSDQANLLGHPREALLLARAGRRGITEDDSPACLAACTFLRLARWPRSRKRRRPLRLWLAPKASSAELSQRTSQSGPGSSTGRTSLVKPRTVSGTCGNQPR